MATRSIIGGRDVFILIPVQTLPIKNGFCKANLKFKQINLTKIKNENKYSNPDAGRIRRLVLNLGAK